LIYESFHGPMNRMSLFTAFFDLIYQYKIRISIIVLLISIMFLLQKWPNVIEGFSEDNVLSQMKNPFFACPVIKRNIQVNEGLIEGFRQADALESLENAKDLIRAFKDKYNELSCETSVFKNLIPDTQPPTV